MQRLCWIQPQFGRHQPVREGHFFPWWLLQSNGARYLVIVSPAEMYTRRGSTAIFMVEGEARGMGKGGLPFGCISGGIGQLVVGCESG